MKGRIYLEQCLIAGLGKEHLILGMPWLREADPIISFKDGTLRIPDSHFNPDPTKDLIGKEQIEQMELDLAALQTPEPSKPDEPEPEEEEVGEDDLLLAYIRGEPVMGIFEKAPESPLTNEERTTSGYWIRTTSLNRVTRSLGST